MMKLFIISLLLQLL